MPATNICGGNWLSELSPCASLSACWWGRWQRWRQLIESSFKINYYRDITKTTAKQTKRSQAKWNETQKQNKIRQSKRNGTQGCAQMDIWLYLGNNTFKLNPVQEPATVSEFFITMSLTCLTFFSCRNLLSRPVVLVLLFLPICPLFGFWVCTHPVQILCHWPTICWRDMAQSFIDSKSTYNTTYISTICSFMGLELGQHQLKNRLLRQTQAL